MYDNFVYYCKRKTTLSINLDTIVQSTYFKYKGLHTAIEFNHLPI